MTAAPTQSTPTFAQLFDAITGNVASPLMGTDILNVSTSDVMPHLNLAAGLLFHYVNNPLALRRVSGDEAIVARLVEHQLKADVSIALGAAVVMEPAVLLYLKTLNMRASRRCCVVAEFDNDELIVAPVTSPTVSVRYEFE